MTSSRFILTMACLLAASACGDDTRVVTEREAGATIELAIGERVRFELATVLERQWNGRTNPEPFILAESETRLDETGDGTLRVSTYEATGGGTQPLVFWEEVRDGAHRPSTPPPVITYTVKVSGPSREDEIHALYKGLIPVGGFGDSRESGRPVKELALFPSDLIAGVDGRLYVASEERIWRIDPQTRIGEIFLDRTRSGGPLPSGAVVTALDQRDTADWLLGLREGTTNTVGWWRADGTWEPVSSWASPRSIHRVRIAVDGAGWVAIDREPGEGLLRTSEPFSTRRCVTAECGDDAPDAVEFAPDGTLYVRGLNANSRTSVLVGRDKDHTPLFFRTDFPNGIAKLHTSSQTPVLLFEVTGIPGRAERIFRRTDFYAFMPAMTVGSGSSKFSWPAQKAAVAQTADGRYWASGVETVQLPPDYKGYNQGRGLYVHE